MSYVLILQEGKREGAAKQEPELQGPELQGPELQ